MFIYIYIYIIYLYIYLLCQERRHAEKNNWVRRAKKTFSRHKGWNLLPKRGNQCSHNRRRTDGEKRKTIEISKNEQFGRKLNETVNGNRKLFWKVVCNAKGGNVENCSRIKDWNGRLAQGADEVRRISKEYFEDLYDIDTQEQVAVHMYGLDGARRGNYFGWELIRRTEVEVRFRKLKNGNSERKDEVTGEMIKGGDDRVVDSIWKLCNMIFESGVVPEEWRSAVIVPLHKTKA